MIKKEKVKEEILKMTRKELLSRKFDHRMNNCYSCEDCSNCSNCSNCCCCIYCSNCYTCSYCINCSNCSDCFGCWDLKKEKYKICNVQFTKEEYEKKIKELKNNVATKKRS